MKRHGGGKGGPPGRGGPPGHGGPPGRGGPPGHGGPQERGGPQGRGGPPGHFGKQGRGGPRGFGGFGHRFGSKAPPRGRGGRGFQRKHGGFGKHFHPKIDKTKIFDPKKFSKNYNPWNPSMWIQDYKPGQAPQAPPPELTQAPPPQEQQVQQQIVQEIPEETQEKLEQEELTQQEEEQETQEDQKLQEEADELFQFASLEQFQELRHHTTEDSAIAQLKELATDVTATDPAQIKPSAASCYICCNSYTKPSYQLGVGPINDAITVAANHRVQGFTVYFVFNATPKVFLAHLKNFLQNTTRYLTVYYTGHGSQVADKDGNEDDGKDEVMVFDSGYIVDDELCKYIKNYSTGTTHTILMSDCCHSGTIWDIPDDITEAQKLPANIISLSAAADSQTAKQATIQSDSQGVFTYNFWTLVRSNPTITADQAEEILNKSLSKFSQELVCTPTRQAMLETPLFPLLKNIK
ncbi:hypothetical protein M9Y10_036388 [Tritrichomonas musculus]|uniref:Peptidase C14 caspase domain-containing protein n=1 Tax=Tritrichomonas musculus TaxID=1915356 RepID=A0ABR2GV93_9EUKA